MPTCIRAPVLAAISFLSILSHGCLSHNPSTIGEASGLQEKHTKLSKLPFASCRDQQSDSSFRIDGLFSLSESGDFRGLQVYGKYLQGNVAKPVNFSKSVYSIQFLNEPGSDCFMFRAFLFNTNAAKERICNQRALEYWKTAEVFPEQNLRELVRACSHDIGKPRIIEISQTHLDGSIKGNKCKYSSFSYYIKKDAIRPLVKRHGDIGGVNFDLGDGCYLNPKGIFHAVRTGNLPAAQLANAGDSKPALENE